MSDTSGVSGFYQIYRDISESIHASGRVEKIAEIVVVKVVQAFGAPGALVEVYHRATAERTCQAVFGLGEIYRQSGLWNSPEEIWQVCEAREVLVMDAPDRNTGLQPRGEAVRPALLVVAPLGLQEELAGYVCLIFQRPREFAPAELEFLAALARQCTLAMDKARLISTQQRQFNQLARQTERLTALGRMAAGVAHELNNPLASILLYSTNMLKKVVPTDPLHDGLEIIIQESKRCKAIIQELQDFSRSKEPRKVPADMNAVLEKVIRLLENEFRRRAVRLHRHLDPGLPSLCLDIGQMQQVLANLLLNALEAVNSKGEITVSTRFDESRQAVSIEVRDNGCGMPPEYLGRLGDPFFSTKPSGTGLGLTVTRGFLLNHQGDLQVESQPGQGSRFTITIPVGTPERDSPGTGC